jgi:hypothetical protein
MSVSRTITVTCRSSFFDETRFIAVPVHFKKLRNEITYKKPAELKRFSFYVLILFTGFLAVCGSLRLFTPRLFRLEPKKNVWSSSSSDTSAESPVFMSRIGKSHKDVETARNSRHLMSEELPFFRQDFSNGMQLII